MLRGLMRCDRCWYMVWLRVCPQGTVLGCASQLLVNDVQNTPYHSWDLPISQEKIRKIQQTRLGYRQKIHAKITRNHLLQNCFRLEFYQIWKIHIPNCIVIQIILYSKVWYMRCHVFLFSTHVLLVHSNALQTSTCTEDQLYHQRLRFPVALPHLRRITGALRLAGCAAARVAEAVPKCGRDSYLKKHVRFEHLKMQDLPQK